MSERLNATNWRRTKTRLLTVDNTVRKIVLTEGRWALFGSATQTTRFTTRNAVDSAGTLDAGETAPNAAAMPVPTAGTPAAGDAFDVGADIGTGEVPQDAASYRYINVEPRQFKVLYVIAPAGTTARLIGPLEWDLVSGEAVG